MYPYSAPRPEPELYECIGCESTDLCRPSELKSRGWEVHKLEDGGEIVLCSECKVTYAERRRIRAALA